MSRNSKEDAGLVERVRARLHYEPETGAFTWRDGKCAGRPAGSRLAAGYVSIGIGPQRFYAHRLAWMYVYGESPGPCLDHIDGDPSNNRIANLRVADAAQNTQNSARHADNKSGLKGVSPCGRTGRWIATIWTNRRKVYLGTFRDKSDAHAAYVKAARHYHGDFARLE